MMVVLSLCCVWWTSLTTKTTTTMWHGVAAFAPQTVVTRSIGQSNPALFAGKIRQITELSSASKIEGQSEGENTTTTTTLVWSPSLRKTMAGIASLGAVETGYLTYAKLFGSGGSGVFCGNSQAAVSSCDQVLSGPYSHLPFFDNVPLASLGFLAYSSIVVLALQPLLGNANNTDRGDNGVAVAVDDTTNRILLTALATSMATFSIFLMTLLFGVLRASCPYCVGSAALSFLLANVALIGGCLPEPSQLQLQSQQPSSQLQEHGGSDDATTTTRADTKAGKTVLAGFTGAVLGSLLLFAEGSVDTINNSGMMGGTSTLVATINGSTSSSSSQQQQQQQQLLYAPPAITTESSERALALGRELSKLGGAKMYGAHWCSHCYDQKEILGKQVFASEREGGFGFVQYVECSRDGVDSKSGVCKEKEIPGYPTWEIKGKLYPGQQELDELEELVKGIKGEAAATAAVERSGQ